MTSAEIDSHWLFSDPAESESRFRGLVERLQGRPRAEAITQVVRALGLQGRFEEGDALLGEADYGGPFAQMRATLERGRLRNSSGDREAARRLFHEALRQAEVLGADFYAVDAAHMLGIAYDGEEAMGWTQTAISMAKESADPRAQGWLGSLLNNFGWNLHDLGRYEEALDTFERALVFREEQGQSDRVHQARWCVARALRSLGRYDEALAIQRDLLHSVPDDRYVREELEELGKAYDRLRA